MDNHQLGGAHQHRGPQSSASSKKSLCCQRSHLCWDTNQGEQSVINDSTNQIWTSITQISLKHKRSIKDWRTHTGLSLWGHHLSAQSGPCLTILSHVEKHVYDKTCNSDTWHSEDIFHNLSSLCSLWQIHASLALEGKIQFELIRIQHHNNTSKEEMTPFACTLSWWYQSSELTAEKLSCLKTLKYTSGSKIIAARSLLVLWTKKL